MAVDPLKEESQQVEDFESSGEMDFAVSIVGEPHRMIVYNYMLTM